MQTIIKELTRPKLGFRVPEYPNPQKTVVVPLLESGTLKTTQVDTDVVLTRDPALPLWATTNEWNTAQVSYYANSSVNAGTFTDTNQISFTGFTFLSCNGGLVAQGANWFQVTAGVPMNPGTTQECKAVLGRFPGTGDIEQVWTLAPVARGANANVALGVDLGGLGKITAGAIDVEVTLAVRSSLESHGATVFTTNAFTTITPTGVGNQVAYGNLILTTVGPCWVTPIGMVLKFFGAPEGPTTVVDFVPRLVIGTSNSIAHSFTPATAGNNNFPRWNPGTFTSTNPSPCVLPVFNAYSSLTALSDAALRAYRAIRVVGCALHISNTTKVINREGAVTAVRYMEGQGDSGNTVMRTPQSIGSFAITEKFVAPMERDIHTAMKADNGFVQISDATVRALLSGPAVPCFDVYPNKHYHLLRFSDEDTATPTSLTYRLFMTLEFASTDPLLSPKISQLTMTATQSAVTQFADLAKHPLFWSSGSNQSLSLADARPSNRPSSKPSKRKRGSNRMWYNGGTAAGPRNAPRKAPPAGGAPPSAAQPRARRAAR